MASSVLRDALRPRTLSHLQLQERRLLREVVQAVRGEFEPLDSDLGERHRAEPPPEQIIEDILLELYAGKRRDNTEQSLKRYNKQLDDWRATLHADLVIAENAVVSPPPNCVTLK